MLKAWLMKWLGVDELRAENAGLHTKNTELIQRLDAFGAEVKHLSDSVGYNAQAVFKCHETLERLIKRVVDDRNTIDDLLARNKRDLIDIVTLAERDKQRISELEVLIKDATLDTALAALEDRVSKIEATPAPTPGPQGRRSGSAWNSHQIAASAGAAREKGIDVPIPNPGVS